VPAIVKVGKGDIGGGCLHKMRRKALAAFDDLSGSRGVDLIQINDSARWRLYDKYLS
jgi:hypothetical protein